MLDRRTDNFSPMASSLAEQMLFHEADCLDQKQWSAWAELYELDAVFWAPAWLDEYEVTNDPNSQLSLIYHSSRTQLQERISRIQSRKSITALPLPRTLHVISNVAVEAEDDSSLAIRSCWTVHVYDPRTFKQHLHFGTYRHRLRKADGIWRIAHKKIVVMNDRIPTILDFYSI